MAFLELKLISLAGACNFNLLIYVFIVIVLDINYLFLFQNNNVTYTLICIFGLSKRNEIIIKKLYPVGLIKKALANFL